MMKKTLLEILVLFFYFTPLALAVESDSSALVIPPGKWWSMPEMAKQLSLSEAEKKKLDDLYVLFHRRLIDRKAVLDKLWLDIDILFGKEDFNESAILEQMNKLEKERSVIAMDRFQFLVDVRKILGQERYQRLKALYQEHNKK